MDDAGLLNSRNGATEGSPWTSLEEPAICLERCFVVLRTCSLAPRRPKVGKTKRGKGTKIMAVADPHGLPVADTSKVLRHIK